MQTALRHVATFLSHDFRAPIRQSATYLQMLAERVDTDADLTREKCLGSAHKASLLSSEVMKQFRADAEIIVVDDTEEGYIIEATAPIQLTKPGSFVC